MEIKLIVEKGVHAQQTMLIVLLFMQQFAAFNQMCQFPSMEDVGKDFHSKFVMEMLEQMTLHLDIQVLWVVALQQWYLTM